MKSPSAESSLKLLDAVDRVLDCPELQREDVSEDTHRLLEELLETSNQVRRECKFPSREEIIKYFSERYAEEDREMLVKRVVAMISTFPNETLYSSYGHLREECGPRRIKDGPKEPRKKE